MNDNKKKTTPNITMIPASRDKEFDKDFNSANTKKLREQYLTYLFPEAFDNEDENDNRCK